MIPLHTPDAPESSTCRSVLIDIIQNLFLKYQQEDPTRILLPWQMDSHLHPILHPDNLPAHQDTTAWDLLWSANPQLSYGHHSWLSLHWGYSTNHVS